MGAALKLLLDTHVWIWSLQEPDRIPKPVQRVITKSGNELYLSPISIWEAFHLHSRKRLRLKQTFPVWLEAGFAAAWRSYGSRRR
jgi:PIN domain nuclease of toxin-antitoxin system